MRLEYPLFHSRRIAPYSLSDFAVQHTASHPADDGPTAANQTNQPVPQELLIRR